MGFFKNEIQINEKPKNNKTDKIKINSVNECGAIKKQLDENNTLTVKQPVANENTKKANVSTVGFHNFNLRNFILRVSNPKILL